MDESNTPTRKPRNSRRRAHCRFAPFKPPVSPHEPSAADEQEPPESGLVVEIAAEAELPVAADRVRAAVFAAFPAEAYESASISVAVVDDPTIHRLNREFLAHDYPTDVLSFALVDEPPVRFEGEIVVSVDTAAAGAVEAGWSAADELLLYVIHGALHLAGHDDHDPAAAGQMLIAEAAALQSLGVVRSAADDRWRPDGGKPSPSSEISSSACSPGGR